MSEFHKSGVRVDRRSRRKRPPEAVARVSRDRSDPITSEPEYTPDELDFLRAIDRYKHANHRPYPTWGEVLAVLESLGWRRTEVPGPPPRFVRGAPGPGRGKN